MGNFCNVAHFTLYLLICKFVTFVKRLKKALCIFKTRNNFLKTDNLPKRFDYLTILPKLDIFRS